MAESHTQNGRSAKAKQSRAKLSPDRLQPYDPVAEIGLLGSIILLPSVFADVMGIVTPTDFYDDSNGGIYSHMLGLHESGKPIDDTLLIDSLKSGGDYEAIGGAGYLAKITNAVPNAAHAYYYAEIVRDKSVYRRVIAAATELLRNAYDESLLPADLVNSGEAHFQRIADRNLAKEDPILIGEAAARVARRIANPELGGGINRCAWGIGDLDDFLGPIMPQEMTVVAARPGQGKTSFAMQVLRGEAERGGKPLIISLEMPDTQLATRELGRIAKIDSRAMRKGKLSEEHRKQILEASFSLTRFPLYVWAPASATFPEIRATMRKAVKKLGVTVVCLDYISLIDTDKEDRGLQREAQVARHSRGLKRLAKELEVPVLALQQLNRDADDCEPSLRHLRESGAIEQDADMVMFLHSGNSGRKDKAATDYWKRQVIVAKFRDGPAGETTVGWSGKQFSFVSIREATAEAAAEGVQKAKDEMKRYEEEDAGLEQQRAMF